jgi:hypothetical protein
MRASGETDNRIMSPIGQTDLNTAHTVIVSDKSPS